MEDAAKVEPAEAKADYGFHSKIISEMRGVLKDGAELGYIWVNILKPDLVDLMNLFIGWGLTIQKKQRLDRAGYHYAGPSLCFMRNWRLRAYILDSLIEWLPSIDAEQARTPEQLSILIGTKR